ncbi:MAG: SDR family NAD(P)-dependent oxidoreductase [Parachlamydiaceae bacterium]
MTKQQFQRVLITGATSGLGEGLACFLAHKKFSLLLTGRNDEKLIQLKHFLSKEALVHTLKGDLGNQVDRDRLIKKIGEWQPDLVINNAGYGLYGNALDFPLPRQVGMLEVNGRACLEITLATIRTLLDANKEGVILNVSSVAGFMTFPGFSIYAASKAFVTSFSQSLDYEYRGKGVRVLTACPGPIKTSFAVRAADGALAKNNLGGISVEQAVLQIWAQITSGQSLKIFDWRYHVASLFSRCLPSRFITPFLYRNVLSRKGGH